MKIYLSDFLSYLRIKKNCSPLTISDYRLELEKFTEYLKKFSNILPKFLFISIVYFYNGVEFE